jgi:hypothetical protein
MKEYRRKLNQQQTQLRDLMTEANDHDLAVKLFLRHHAMLHSADMSSAQLWSYEDELLEGIPEDIFRRIPQNCEHSIAWCIWHIARIEDVTMNILVADETQVFLQEDWPGRLRIRWRHTGNEMAPEDIVDLSRVIDLEMLKLYRLTVGQKTQAIVRTLSKEDLKENVDPVRLDRVMEEEALLPEAVGIKEYWGRRDLAGILLMPPTRHAVVHLNEAARLKKRKM